MTLSNFPKAWEPGYQLRLFAPELVFITPVLALQPLHHPWALLGLQQTHPLGPYHLLASGWRQKRSSVGRLLPKSQLSYNCNRPYHFHLPLRRLENISRDAGFSWSGQCLQCVRGIQGLQPASQLAWSKEVLQLSNQSGAFILLQKDLTPLCSPCNLYTGQIVSSYDRFAI